MGCPVSIERMHQQDPIYSSAMRATINTHETISRPTKSANTQPKATTLRSMMFT
jgi:hypothetical protein